MPGNIDIKDEKYLIRGIVESDRKAFSALFDIYYVDLVMFCGNYVGDLEKCRDIVSSVFMTLWENGPKIRIEKSLKSYLLNMVRNRALNEIRHSRVVETHVNEIACGGILASHDVENYILYTDMKSRIEKTVSSMPDKIRETYLCFVEEGMKSKDIAQACNVSQRTVELRINKALELLRKALPVLLALFAIN
ncbi:MAG: RNA polymerase sigma-70 factor [Candidatus Cryptobacteroides sp.]